MRLFIFGAGATRGASFVDVESNPCLPPLDSDFFTQLQRIKNSKHSSTIELVLQNTVELFGVNFQLTLENLFSTIENMRRMIKMAGERRGFKKEDLDKMRKILLQALAAVLEESLTKKGSSLQVQECKYHEYLIKEVIQPKDSLISFNYDCLLDYVLKKYGNEKWNPHYGYGFQLRGEESGIKGDDCWCPEKPAQKDKTVKFYKLHGSLHFKFDNKKTVRLKKKPYTKQNGDLLFDIIPPEVYKDLEKTPYKNLWKKAGQAIYKANIIVIIGYSFPITDLHSRTLFQVNIHKDNLKKIVIVNPDKQSRYRAREILRRGITNKTKILVFDTLKEFFDAKVDLNQA